jgi:hypothetical protein
MELGEHALRESGDLVHLVRGERVRLVAHEQIDMFIAAGDEEAVLSDLDKPLVRHDQPVRAQPKGGHRLSGIAPDSVNVTARARPVQLLIPVRDVARLSSPTLTPWGQALTGLSSFCSFSGPSLDEMASNGRVGMPS